jgi:hypothetical protein
MRDLAKYLTGAFIGVALTAAYAAHIWPTQLPHTHLQVTRL